jgi:hypothetical protein
MRRRKVLVCCGFFYLPGDGARPNDRMFFFYIYTKIKAMKIKDTKLVPLSLSVNFPFNVVAINLSFFLLKISYPENAGQRNSCSGQKTLDYS